MRTLTITTETFEKMLNGLIQSGITFAAKECENGDITITFTGGY